MNKSEKTFEDSMNELEEILNELEKGDLSLEESIELYEKGIKIRKECEGFLGECKNRVEKLMRTKDGVKKEDYKS